MKFDRTNLDLWVAALRSGKYPQGKGKLRTKEGFCCLGVGCEVAGIPSEIRFGNWRYGARGSALVAPDEFCEWLGVNPYYFETGGSFEADGRWDSLAKRNDEGATFEEIADLIEEHIGEWLPKGVEL